MPAYELQSCCIVLYFLPLFLILSCFPLKQELEIRKSAGLMQEKCMNRGLNNGHHCTYSHNNISSVLTPSPLSNLHHQLVVKHADLQDTAARCSLQTTCEADGGFSGALCPRALHLQWRPHHKKHPALTLLCQVRVKLFYEFCTIQNEWWSALIWFSEMAWISLISLQTACFFI